jgi:hypothetical protein
MPGSVSVVPILVTLGTATGDDIPPGRLRFYERVAGRMFPGRTVTVETVPAVALTIYELNHSPWRMLGKVRALTPPAGEHDDQLIVVDFTASSPRYIRPVLLALAGEALGELLAEDGRRSALLINFSLDGARVPVGEALEVAASGRGPAGWIEIRDPAGTGVRLDIRGKTVGQLAADPEFAEQLRHLDEPALGRDVTKVIRRVGHFAYGSTGDRCAPYYFDASLAVDDIVQSWSERLRAELADVSMAAIAVHQTGSPWLLTVARRVAQTLDVEFVDLSPSGTEVSPGVGIRPVILLLDMVNSGETLQRLIREQVKRGVRLGKNVFAVISDVGRTASSEMVRQITAGAEAFTVHSIFVRDFRSLRRDDCGACKFHLPCDKPADDELPGFTSFQMWQLMLSFAWVSEPYGSWEQASDSIRPFSSTPNFPRMLQEHGDWIAWKLNQRLASTGLPAPMVDEIIYVSPDEPAMRQLAQWLKAQREGRPGVVHIPRPVLSQVSRGVSVDDLKMPRSDARGHGEWRVKLASLNDRQRFNVVVVDEFNASDTTAIAMVTLLATFRIKPLAYIPILNRKPSRHIEVSGLAPVPVYPLYEISSPRSSTAVEQ